MMCTAFVGLSSKAPKPLPVFFDVMPVVDFLDALCDDAVDKASISMTVTTAVPRYLIYLCVCVCERKQFLFGPTICSLFNSS